MNRWMTLFVVLLLVPAVMAADADVKSQALAAAAAQAECRITFATGVISATTASIPSASTLSSQSAALQSDLTQLQQLQSAGDPKAYREFIQSHLEPDMKGASAAMKAARQSAKNVSKEARQALLASLKQLQQTNQGCEFQALQKVANLRVQIYTDQLNQRSAQLTNLSGRGFDVSQMQAIVSGAQTQIITPLQTAISAATDTKSLHAALQQYCLYDGCKNGVNYHLAAKLDIARLQMVLNKFKATPKAANESSQIATAQAAIDSASSALSSVGTSVYTPQTHDQVWDAIKQAAQSLKGIFSQRVHGEKEGAENGKGPEGQGPPGLNKTGGAQ